jgi:hypothetical protein
MSYGACFPVSTGQKNKSPHYASLLKPRTEAGAIFLGKLGMTPKELGAMIIKLDGKPFSHARKANAKASGGRGALRRNPFHGKRFLRREYHGLMAIVMSLESARNRLVVDLPAYFYAYGLHRRSQRPPTHSVAKKLMRHFA